MFKLGDVFISQIVILLPNPINLGVSGNLNSLKQAPVRFHRDHLDIIMLFSKITDL